MTSCSTYTERFISRFVDDEVSSADHGHFVHHMGRCRACAETENRFRQANRAFENHISTQSRKIPPISLEKKQTPARGMVLKLASLGTAALIFTLALLPWAGDPVSESSAIVNSVDTYGSSVMIIETKESRHTIIWFSET